jgi:hypothetical protein
VFCCVIEWFFLVGSRLVVGVGALRGGVGGFLFGSCLLLVGVVA